jgi:hypothetical protein
MIKPVKYQEGLCTICTRHFSALHWHHTVPQALGGKDSLQIPLCGSCHTQLHAHAEGIVARQRTGRKVKRTYWSNPEEETRARPYIEILVTSILNASSSLAGKVFVVQSRIPAEVHRALHLYKMDSGLGNLDQALLLCLCETLKKKGYLNGNDKPHSQAGESEPKKPAASLW